MAMKSELKHNPGFIPEIFPLASTSGFAFKLLGFSSTWLRGFSSSQGAVVQSCCLAEQGASNAGHTPQVASKSVTLRCLETQNFGHELKAAVAAFPNRSLQTLEDINEVPVQGRWPDSCRGGPENQVDPTGHQQKDLQFIEAAI